MSEKEFVIDMEDDTEGHGGIGAKIVESGDVDWLEDRLRKDSGKSRFRITLGDEDDTEGHGGGGSTLLLNLVDDDDTEGHAIAVHFPSRAEADAFRRRLLVTGVLVGTVALGAAGGIGLSALQSDTGAAGAGTVATQQAGPMDVHEAPAFQAAAAPIDASADVGIMDASNAAAAAAVGPLDAHEAPAFQADGGLSQADQAYADRLAGLAAASQTGPMDAHEAPAFQGLSQSDQAYADRLSRPRQLLADWTDGCPRGTRVPGPLPGGSGLCRPALRAGSGSRSGDRRRQRSGHHGRLRRSWQRERQQHQSEGPRTPIDPRTEAHKNRGPVIRPPVLFVTRWWRSCHRAAPTRR